MAAQNKLHTDAEERSISSLRSSVRFDRWDRPNLPNWDK